MIDLNTLDITGDLVFNGLDLLVGIFNLIFYYGLYKIAKSVS